MLAVESSGNRVNPYASPASARGQGKSLLRLLKRLFIATLFMISAVAVASPVLIAISFASMVDPETQLDDKWNIIIQRMFFSGVGQAAFFVACSLLSIAFLYFSAFCLFKRK